MKEVFIGASKTFPCFTQWVKIHDEGIYVILIGLLDTVPLRLVGVYAPNSNSNTGGRAGLIRELHRNGGY